MRYSLLKSKIHRAVVTDADLNYHGSITIDGDLMERAGIVAYEKVAVANLSNGCRFETYVIEGKRQSGIVCLNGAAARCAQPGDLVIIMAYGEVDQDEISEFRPKVVLVDANNRPRSKDNAALN